MPILLGSGMFAAWTAAVAISDCRTRRVPNALVAAGLAAAAGCSLLRASPFGIAPLQAMAGIAVGFFVLLPFFLLRVMCGTSALLGLWLAASLAAALHALALLIAARKPVRALWRRGQPTFLVDKRRATPYAALLVAAAALSLMAHRMAGVSP
jgi:prepilin peptidase CpaA